jgi:YcxB-like protein
MPETVDGAVFRCELGRDEVREVMAASGLISLLRRSWLIAGVLFATLLAGAVVLLRAVATRPAAGGSHHQLLVAELAAGSGLAALLVLWSAQRVWRLSPGRQATRALVGGMWQRGVHEYKLLVEGVAWHSPDGSATFLPWSALSGVRETKRLFLLLDQEGRHVRGFIPKAGLAHLPAEVGVVRLIRDQIMTGTLSAWFTPEQRVAPQQVTAVPHAGEQPAGGRADLAPRHVGVLNGGA